MRAYIAINVMGCFAFDPDGNLLEKKLFSKRPEEIAEKLDEKGLLPEEEELFRMLIARGIKEVFTDKKVQFKGINIVYEEDNPGKKALQEGFRGMAISLKWVSSQGELNELLSKVQVLRTREKLREEKKDKIIIHAIGVLGDMEKHLNTFSERLREWYGLHFPELSSQLKSHEKFAETVAKYGKRTAVKEFESLAKESSGMDFSDADINEIKDFARVLVDLYRRKHTLSQYIENICQEVVPNTAAVAGEVLAARLLSHAGSLEKLSRMPTSTVQVLGAEKALFRHLKGGGKPPKFGVLFAHPLVQNAEQEKRGKAARMVAAKISLAAKTDYFSKENKGEMLKKQLEDEFKSLR